MSAPDRSLPTHPTAEQDRQAPTPGALAQDSARVPFEAPRLEKRGALPKVTTAFGATFNP